MRTSAILALVVLPSAIGWYILIRGVVFPLVHAVYFTVHTFATCSLKPGHRWYEWFGILWREFSRSLAIFVLQASR